MRDTAETLLAKQIAVVRDIAKRCAETHEQTRNGSLTEATRAYFDGARLAYSLMMESLDRIVRRYGL